MVIGMHTVANIHSGTQLTRRQRIYAFALVTTLFFTCKCVLSVFGMSEPSGKGASPMV